MKLQATIQQQESESRRVNVRTLTRRSPAAARTRTPLPGRAGATPCVWGDRIYLTSNEGDDLVVLCIAAEDGAIKWKRTVGSGNQDARAGEGNSASP